LFEKDFIKKVCDMHYIVKKECNCHFVLFIKNFW